MTCGGYHGGGSRPRRTFRTGLVGDDSTGANIVSKRNATVQNQKGKRTGKAGRGRWG